MPGYGSNAEPEVVLPVGQMSLSDTTPNQPSPASTKTKTKSVKTRALHHTVTCDYWNKCLRFFDSLSVSGELSMS